MGGLLVSSEPDRGTTFEVYLPVAEENAGGGEFSKPSPSKGGETILFIDDVDYIANLGKDLLEGFGYKVTPMTDPLQALEMFRFSPRQFDLMITDQGMPKMTGEQLVVELRKIDPAIPIILSTGYSETMTPESSRELGIDAFLYKPVGGDELGRTVRAVLDERK